MDRRTFLAGLAFLGSLGLARPGRRRTDFDYADVYGEAVPSEGACPRPGGAGAVGRCDIVPYIDGRPARRIVRASATVGWADQLVGSPRFPGETRRVRGEVQLLWATPERLSALHSQG